MKLELVSLKEAKRGLPTFIFIANSGDDFLKNFTEFSNEYNFYQLEHDLTRPDLVLDYAQSCIDLFKENKIRSISLVGVDSGGALAQAVAVRTWRILRRLVLVDSVTRVNTTFFEKVLNRVESFLPLGLPLRKRSNAYDSRPELHRVQCPTLIFRSKDSSADTSSAFLDYQANLLNKSIPNSWMKRLENKSELIKEILEFEKVPAKRSQTS